MNKPEKRRTSASGLQQGNAKAGNSQSSPENHSGHYVCSCGMIWNIDVSAGSLTNMWVELWLAPCRRPGHELKKVS